MLGNLLEPELCQPLKEKSARPNYTTAVQEAALCEKGAAPSQRRAGPPAPDPGPCGGQHGPRAQPFRAPGDGKRTCQQALEAKQKNRGLKR